MSDKMRECPGCAVMVDPDAKICPICGYEFPQQSIVTQIAIWVMIILLVIYWLVW